MIAEEDELAIVLLTADHARKTFDCGQADLNRYLQQTAQQHQKKQVSRTWVAVRPAQPSTILGFYTTTLAEIPAAIIELAGHPDRYLKIVALQS